MNLNYPEQIYVGYKPREDEVPLAFAVDSTNNKTKLTVDRWRDKSINTSIFTNEPLAGFKIDGTRRRLSTSNVLFEVTDPRGFNLQISAENMMLIINTIGIAKGGVIQGNCYWAFNQGKAFLCSDAMGFTEQLLLKRSMKKYKTIKCQDCKVGDTFWSSDGFSKITYMGITYVHSKGISGKLLVKQQHTLKINDELYYHDGFSSIKQIDSVEVDLNELIRVYSKWRVFHYQELSGFELSYEPNHRGNYVYKGEWLVSIKGKEYKLTDVFDDWPYVSSSTPYTKIVSDETYYQVLSKSLGTSSWSHYQLKDIFNIIGSKTTPLLELEEYGSGKYPYVTTQATNNGIDGFYDFFTEEGNILTIDSAIFGYCAYQPLKFSASDHVEKLIPTFEMNQYIALFLVTILNLEQYRYNYGRKCSQTRMRRISIKLPTKNNEPDFEFMENYIKSLPYSSSLII